MTITEQAVEKGFITIADAGLLAGMSVQGMRKKLKDIPKPVYFVKLSNRYFVNPEDPLFKIMVPAKKNNTLSELDNINKSELQDDLNDLKIKSVNAKLLQEVQKWELNKYELEKKRVELQQQAGDIIETPLAEFLFVGYLEKANRELLAMPKRIIREIGLIIKDGIYTKEDEKKITDKTMKVVAREIEVILRDVKKQQKKDIKNWRENLGIN